MPTAVLATKLYAPAGRSQAVARSRLVEQLEASLAPGHRLTLVSAPAGFGKTTVLSDWVHHLAGHPSGACTGWLSLDAGDNDLMRFLSHLVAALGSAGVELDTEKVLGPLPGDPTAALTALLNAVADGQTRSPGVPRVLVWDDFHVITASEVHEAVVFLLEHLPDHVHVAMATRADPPLPLARLRSRGQLTEVRVGDLRFTRDEAQQFLTGSMGLQLEVADVDALEERTEGWVAGLQLAALSLRAIPTRSGVAGFIDAFTGSNRFVIDYLVDEVLARQAAEVREFLLRTSVLDRLTGPLCDSVLDRSGGTAMLEDLERGNLFVVPLDAERSWYRYHHLFADVLRARLLTEEPDMAARLHRRASDWYAGNGFVADAFGHALAAGDFARAGHLLEEALPDLRRTRQDSRLLTWIRALPHGVVARSPVLSTVAGWARLMAGDLDALESCLDEADAALEAGAEDPALAASWAQTEDLRTAPASILIYRASLAQARGDTARTVQYAQRALDLAGPEDHVVHGGAGGFLGLAAWAAGDLREAIDTFSQAVRSLQAAGNVVDALDATVVLADMWVASGRPSRARAAYERALQTVTDNGEPYPRAAADLHVGLAELDRELDDLTAAHAHLEAAAVLAERASITENRYRLPMVTAQVRAANGDLEAARTLFEESATLYRPGFYPDVRPVEAMRARMHIAAGDLDAADAWLRERGLSAADDPDYLHEYELLTLARLLLAQGRQARGGDVALTTARTLLDRLHRAADEAQRGGSLLEIRMLQALAHHVDGDLAAALALLRRSLADAPETDSRVRLYLDEGPPMLELLRDVVEARRADKDEAVQVWARRLLERMPSSAARGGAARQPLADPLSQRELEVLRLLDSELTGPEIAGALYVSLNTLRTHTKRIFTKLDVRTRAAAVRSAHEHGLL